MLPATENLQLLNFACEAILSKGVALRLFQVKTHTHTLTFTHTHTHKVACSFKQMHTFDSFYIRFCILR